ncbi:MAG: type I methionyl aminopeptidase [Chloroflexota bacterium]
MIFQRRRVTLKSRAQIERMSVAGRLVADALDAVGQAVRPGVTPLDLDAIAGEFIRSRGGTPSFVGVPGQLAPFEHTLCISLDEEVVHGVPDGRVIRVGQLVSVDCGAIVDGWHGDSARTFLVGDVSEEARHLSAATREAMLAGINAAVPGNTLEDVAGAIEDVGVSHGYGIVRAYVGHGIGNEMHEEPQVTNYRTGKKGRRIEPGLCLAIEPMFTLGGHDTRVSGAKAWTVATADGSLAAHWEHTIAISDDGPRILTLGASESVTDQAAVVGAPA